MPQIELTYPHGALAIESRDPLLDRLAETLLRWEGAPDNEFFRSIAWIYAHELPDGALAVGGRRDDTAPRYRLDVTVPDGALSARRKAGLVEELTRLVLETAEGSDVADDDAAKLRVWVLIRELPNGNWGAAGAPVDFEALRATAREQRETAAANA